MYKDYNHNPLSPMAREKRPIEYTNVSVASVQHDQFERDHFQTYSNM